MSKHSLADEYNSLMGFDLTEDHLQLSPQDPGNLLRVVSRLEAETEHHFPCDKERTRCKIKIRIHHLDADQTSQLQQLLEQFAADASAEFDVKLSMKQHRPTSSLASSLSQLSEDYRVPASSSAGILDYIMQACEPSLAGSIDPQPLSPTGSSDVANAYMARTYQSDDDDCHGNSPMQLPASPLTVGSPCAGLTHRFTKSRRFDERSVVSAPVI